ncbi:hypothetical protein HHI36_021251 [Cryptolaemus montrouzieri]|uniref:LNR domain-containing protein n=1 Tax=Cryptolaemus montrouzieri TaxID=559131 RepID=A0ABD2MX09_9CUCU
MHFLLISFHICEVFLHIFPGFYKQCPEKERIDVVYTWVNGSDPIFLEKLKNYLKTKNIIIEKKILGQRFDDKHELKFSLRSLEKYAPWINHVYIVTNGQIPYWLNLDYEKLLYPAIESHLHRIQGLSKKFLYFNDDVFLGQPVYLEDFISSNNGYMLYLSYPLGLCAPNCFWAYVADDQCDEACNNYDCQYDGGDCEKQHDTDQDEYNYSLAEYNRNDSSAILRYNRKIQSFNEDLHDQFKINLTRFKIPKEVPEKKNFSVIVEAYNDKVIQNEKIKRKRFKRKQRKLRVMKYLRRDNKESRTFNATKCAYAASLQHSNRIFNAKYGFMPRAVPSHTPILIDKDIMESLQKKLFKEILITSKNRFRNSDDLQFAFSYFDLFDTDSSGTWADREIRTLLTRIYQLPLSYTIVEHFESILMNCSEKKTYKRVKAPEYERYSDSRMPTITKELVLDCPKLGEMLISHFGGNKKYKYQIVKEVGNQYLYFIQLNSNVTDVVGHLDDIRSEPRKFICLNDNLDHTKTVENEFITSVIYDFYMSFFPFPSKFELPKEYRNRFLHIDELNEWKYHHFKVKLFIYFVALFIFT